MMKRSRAIVGLPVFLLASLPIAATPQDATPANALASYNLSAPDSIWALPKRLREISGLATSGAGRLLAHDDELALVYEFNPITGELTKAFAFGDATAAGDFEGIATAGNQTYLVSSDGRIYEAPEGADGDRVLYNTYGTSAGRFCEIEGLTLDHAGRNLVMICKTVRHDRDANYVTLIRWSVESKTMAADSMLSIPLLRFTSRLDEADGFNPSGIASHPNGNFLIIAARQSAIAEISPDGEVVAMHEFSRRAHRQVEGIEIGRDGSLYLADEGRNGRARISIYHPR